MSIDSALPSTSTRWWWVRHAPVTVNQGRLYGRSDPPCETSDVEAFEGLAKILPGQAAWVVSDLQRTHQTAAAIVAAGLTGPEKFPGEGVVTERDFAEQDFGAWQGMTYAELADPSRQDYHQFWVAPAHKRPPQGESFVDLLERVSSGIKRITRSHTLQDIIAVAHGGTIRAAVAVALGLPPANALSLTIGNLSVTRLDHFLIDGKESWKVHYVNRPPR
ncbi:MAG TPA: histidine phosphatase family protein [Stellaceae bacterium]|jgi:broad specificity phosphatase PhoE|nr:histidine phosphatase family protein [Stellaceae bacterium]